MSTERFGSSYDSERVSLPKGEGEVGLPAAAVRPVRRLSLLSMWTSLLLPRFSLDLAFLGRGLGRTRLTRNRLLAGES